MKILEGFFDEIDKDDIEVTDALDDESPMSENRYARLILMEINEHECQD